MNHFQFLLTKMHTAVKTVLTSLEISWFKKLMDQGITLFISAVNISINVFVTTRSEGYSMIPNRYKTGKMLK